LPTYPESADSLKKFIDDVFVAMKSGDSEKTSLYFTSLLIPDYNSWFTNMFGVEDGPRMASEYEALLKQSPSNIQQSFEYPLKTERTDVEISVLQKPLNSSSHVLDAGIAAMLHPIPLYVADGKSPKEKYSASIGNFVYVDGGFRYMDTQVFQVLRTAPPLRIRLGGNVAAAKLVHRVQPAYPDEARKTRAQGAVMLHVVLSVDGVVKEMTPISGDPALARAAADAVRRWQYQPTLLNGKPVEVDTTVSVEFRIN
jgi:TonB family protein